jgi:hypothetical protein
MIATETQALWAKEVYANTDRYSDTEIGIAYHILSGQTFDKTAVEWAKGVYSEPNSHTDLDIAVAYDILRESRLQGNT